MKTIITERIEANGKAMERTVELQVEIGDSHLFDYRLLAKNLHTLLQEAKYLEMDNPPRNSADKSDDGWIEWKGGECPVEQISLVNFRIRDERHRGNPNGAFVAGELEWKHEGIYSDIIAYRLAFDKTEGAS